MNNKRKKIGILTLPITTNYGGILQLYALYTIIDKLGYEPIHIRRRWNADSYNLLHKIKKYIYRHFILYKFNKFENTYIPNRTDIIDKDCNFKNICHCFDSIVVGSDQVWRIKNTRGVGYNYFLDFEKKNLKKISYAASFGVDFWEETSREETNHIKKLLQDFDTITIRENSGVNICKETFNVNATQVLDPTLLLNKEEYIKALSLKLQHKKERILAVYLLDETTEKIKYVKTFAKKNNLTIKWINKTRISRFNSFLPADLTKSSIIQWLNGIYNSDFVITDSFHGTAFSIIFNKPFYSIDNIRRGSTRFKSLFDYLEIDNRLIKDINDTSWLSIKNINYTEINNRMTILKEESIKNLYI